ncbi:uncharacterized protein A4U43_C08F5600 [Asparagus officinalis]|nr:uncharacterized protein A4U43_C08F5600 [Asparagus officinalis]
MHLNGDGFDGIEILIHKSGGPKSFAYVMFLEVIFGGFSNYESKQTCWRTEIIVHHLEQLKSYGVSTTYSKECSKVDPVHEFFELFNRALQKREGYLIEQCCSGYKMQSD